MKRLRRAAVLTLSLAGLLGTSLPPASATEAGGLIFAGHFIYHPGLAFPFFPPGDPTKVPDPTNPSFSDNSVSFGFASTTCEGASLTAGKNKPTLNGPGCAIGATGIAHGFCGLSHGTVHGTLTIGSQDFIFSATFTEIFFIFAFSGFIAKSNGSGSGVIHGAALLTPNPPPDPTSCTTKGLHSFRMIGQTNFLLVTG